MQQSSTWANQYEQLASATDLINESVNIIIKEKHVHQYPQLSTRPSFYLSEQQINQARTTVADLVSALIDENIDEPTGDESHVHLPDNLLDDYRTRLDNNPNARERFEQLRDTLQSDQPVDDSGKAALDDLVLTLNNSRKQIFRKLRQYGS
ncbi:hypothetical protein [Fibrella forsythiae]|uniref:Uncharacterized protein n=1 Tax=Fibrella forsythiae TaxID=2817061 RepID=A0ABS3JJE3_9BACT|nr:hypothetical protein [Fibrella forsythiae]MBO0950126.1 hypothetical protein [Fibrella forsythiae]